MPLNPFDADKHHIALGTDTAYGWTLENAYAKFMQKETPQSAGSDFGGTLDLIASDKPEVSRWTQDEFTGGTFQYRYDTDAAMFADCMGYIPAQQSRTLVTVPPVFFRRDFNVEDQPNPAGRSNLTNPSSMFTVAGSIFVCFEHGILRYITGSDSFVWGSSYIDTAADGNRHWCEPRAGPAICSGAKAGRERCVSLYRAAPSTRETRKFARPK